MGQLTAQQQNKQDGFYENLEKIVNELKSSVRLAQVRLTIARSCSIPQARLEAGRARLL